VHTSGIATYMGYTRCLVCVVLHNNNLSHNLSYDKQPFCVSKDESNDQEKKKFHGIPLLAVNDCCICVQTTQPVIDTYDIYKHKSEV